MNEHRFHNCSIARSLDVFGDRWTFLVLRESFFGVKRFGQIARNLSISRNILSDRLGRLVEHGVLERHRYRRDPDRYEYRLTGAGLELYPAIAAMLRWGDDHLAGPEGPPLVLRHRSCGHEARPLLVCSHCGRAIEAHDIEPLPGPGAYAGIADEPAA